jgi:NAD(P)-dependent dehydrogenase (short-subunit alcohol dehydrogenase family)
MVMDSNLDGAATLQDAHPGRLLLREVNVTDRAAVRQAFVDAKQWAGRGATGLICCAGIQRKVPSIELTPDQWHGVLDVHLDGTLWPSQAAAEQMSEEGGGSIVAFSSVAQTFAWPGRLPYAVAKSGISAFVRTLAVEWAKRGIRVNAVAPGYVDTPLLTPLSESIKAMITTRIPLGRMARAEELAEMVRFLVGPEAGYCTGEIISVSGGYHG